MKARHWNPGLLLLACALGVLLLFAVPNASAAVRFAAPDGIGTGIGPDPCPEAEPCSIFTAADQDGTAAPGDEVVLAPGVYSDTAGDLGPDGFVVLTQNIDVRGEPDQPRPLIKIEELGPSLLTGAFLVVEGNRVAHIEIETAVAINNISINDGIVEGLIARSSTEEAVVCDQKGGILRSSACLSSGPLSVAVGSDFASSPNVLEAKLRNVTALATGPNSVGVGYRVAGEVDYTVDAIGVIAQGTNRDVRAIGHSQFPNNPGTGANMEVLLDQSNYDSIARFVDAGGGTATVSPTGPGTTNENAAPLLTADGHQLAGSVTIDNGATDADSAATDIDGQVRTLGAAADIGADEFEPPFTTVPTATKLSCSPVTLKAGDSSRCTATVENATADLRVPNGHVQFTAQGGNFSGAGRCTLAGDGEGRASCQLTYTPPAAPGTYGVTARYPGGPDHEPSEDTVSLRLVPQVVTPPIAVGDASVGIEILGKRVRLSGGGVAHFRLRCPSSELTPPCRGELALRTVRRVIFGGKRSRVVLGRGSFEIAAGQVAPVRIEIPAGKAGLLRREVQAQQVLLIVGVTDGAGNSGTSQRNLRIVPGPPKAPARR